MFKPFSQAARIGQAGSGTIPGLPGVFGPTCVGKAARNQSFSKTVKVFQ
jgi:hypothetical protein